MFIAIAFIISGMLTEGFVSVLLFAIGIMFLVHNVAKSAEVLNQAEQSQTDTCPPHK